MTEIIDYRNGKFIKLNSFGKIEEITNDNSSDINEDLFLGKKTNILINIQDNIFTSTLTKFVGILHVSSKSIVKNGIKKNGMCRKQFTPFIKHLPKILVKTNRIESGPDEYVIVKFERMEGNIMYCEVESYLGKINGYELDLVMVRNMAQCHWTNKYNKNFANLSDFDNCTSRIDMSNDNTIIAYSVDPQGCEDIDDAIHVKKTEKYFEIGIHISDVSSYIDGGSIFDTELSKRVETLYFNNNDMDTIHMIPPQLSINYMSLKTNCPKRTFSVIIKTDHNFNILNVEFKRLLIKISKNLSYDEAENILLSDANMKSIYDAGFELKKQMSNSFNDKIKYDTHQMIEVYMVLANKLVAEKLAGNCKFGNKDYVLLRSKHADNISNISNDNESMKNLTLNSIADPIADPNNLENNLSSELMKILIEKHEICCFEKAIYQIGVDNCEHSKLKLKYYTHFTSPMRRYADILVHRQLEKILKDEEIEKMSVEKVFFLNFYSSFYKKISRYSNLIYVIKNIKNTSIYNACVVMIKNDYKIRLYIQELDLDYDYKIVDNKIKHLIDLQINEKTLILKNIVTEKFIEIKLFQQIKIRIAKIEKSLEKICVTMTEPDVMLILC